MKRRATAILVGLAVFAHVSVALAICATDRGALGRTMAMDANESCDGCNPNLCVVHCTADLQLVAVSVSIVRAPAATAQLIVPLQNTVRLGAGLLGEPPPKAPPSRILLHSFLI